MPQLIAGALTTAAPGLFGAAIIGPVNLGQIVGYLVFSSLTNAAMKNLRNSTSIQSRTLNIREPLGAEAVIYGECRVGGNVTFMETANDGRYVIQVITVAGHEIEQFNSGGVYLNEENVTLDGSGYVTTDGWDGQAIQMKFFDGSQTAVSSDLNTWSDSGNITSNFIGHERAYVAIRYDFEKGAMKRGIPNCSFVVQGKKVYDPRTTTTTYSANAALCIRDWLASKHGINAVAAELPDSFWNAEANVCDENVSLSGGGTEKRYEINGTFRTTDGRDQILQKMLSACGGALIHSQGYYLLKTGYYTAPTVTLTEDDLRSDVSLETRTSAQQNFNTVRGTFADAGNDYLPVEFDEISPAGFLSEDDGNAVPASVELPFTTSAAAAQRLAKMMLYRAREQYTLSATFGLKAIQLAVGDTVTLNINGVVNETFEVESWEPEKADDAGLAVKLVLRETSSAAYSWSAEESAIVRANAVIDPDALVDRYNIRTVVSSTYDNLLRAQSAFDDATWSKSRTTITADDIAAPDGASDGDKLVEDTAAGTHNTFQEVSTVTAGAAVVASVYLRADERQYAEFRAVEDAAVASLGGVVVDLSAGTIVSTINSGALDDSGISDAGNGWYRVYLKWTTAGTMSTVGLRIGIRTGASGVTSSYTGDGSSGLHMWGAMLRAGTAHKNFAGYEVVAGLVPPSGGDHNRLTWHFKNSQLTTPARPPRADDMLIVHGWAGVTSTAKQTAAFVFNGVDWDQVDHFIGGDGIIDETVGTTQLTDDAITTAKVATDAIATGNVIDNAITEAQTGVVSSFSTSNNSWTTAATLSFSATSGVALVVNLSFRFVFNMDDAGDGCRWRVQRNGSTETQFDFAPPGSPATHELWMAPSFKKTATSSETWTLQLYNGGAGTVGTSVTVEDFVAWAIEAKK